MLTLKENNTAGYLRQKVPTSTTKPIITYPDDQPVANVVYDASKYYDYWESLAKIDKRDELNTLSPTQIISLAKKMANSYRPATDLNKDFKRLRAAIAGESNVTKTPAKFKASKANLKGKVALAGITKPKRLGPGVNDAIAHTITPERAVDMWAPSSKTRNQQVHSLVGNSSKRNKKGKGVMAIYKAPKLPSMMNNLRTLPVTTSIPVSESFIRTSRSGPQRLADVDNEGSIRIEFCDMLSVYVQAGSTTAAAGFGGTATYNVIISPANVSTRLAAYEAMYSSYAFREIQYTYIPTTSSATAVGVNVGIVPSQLAAGAYAAPTTQAVLQMRPSMGTAAWQPSEMRYQHTGTNTFSTVASGGDYHDYWQAQLFCTLDGTPVAGTTYGKLRVMGYIDFYLPRPYNTANPSLTLYASLNGITPTERYLKLREWMDCVQRNIPFINAVNYPHPFTGHRGSHDPSERNGCLPAVPKGVVYKISDFQPLMIDKHVIPIQVPKPTTPGQVESAELVEEEKWEEVTSRS